MLTPRQQATLVALCRCMVPLPDEPDPAAVRLARAVEVRLDGMDPEQGRRVGGLLSAMAAPAAGLVNAGRALGFALLLVLLGGFGLWRLLSARHFRWAGMRLSAAQLAGWIKRLPTNRANPYLKPDGLAHEVSDMMQVHGVPPFDASQLSQGSMDMRPKVWAVAADLDELELGVTDERLRDHLDGRCNLGHRLRRCLLIQ